MTMQRMLVLSAWAVLGLAASARAQLPAGTSFTFQGRLEDGGSPATGSYDFEFRLFGAAAGGTQVGGTVARPGVAVAAGLFTVDLDFGAGVFTGDALWLEVAVRPAGTGAFTALSPRQRATGAPYAIHALSIPLAGSGTAATAARSDHDHAGTYATSVHTHDAADLTSGTIAPARVSGAYGGITGVGTLGSGTWNASAIGPLFGGTGQTSLDHGRPALRQRVEHAGASPGRRERPGAVGRERRADVGGPPTPTTIWDSCGRRPSTCTR